MWGYGRVGGAKNGIELNTPPVSMEAAGLGNGGAVGIVFSRNLPMRESSPQVPDGVFGRCPSMSLLRALRSKFQSRSH